MIHGNFDSRGRLKLQKNGRKILEMIVNELDQNFEASEDFMKEPPGTTRPETELWPITL